VEGIIMTDDMQTSAIITAGMRLLRENLGVVEAEIFITNIKQERFDYTEWRRDNLFEDKSPDELLKNAVDYMREHPELVPKNATVI
jgi:hypothetical protein